MDFEALLKLLLSENRAKRNQDEQRRIRKYLERVNKAIRKQRAIADQTRRAGAAIHRWEQNPRRTKGGKPGS